MKLRENLNVRHLIATCFFVLALPAVYGASSSVAQEVSPDAEIVEKPTSAENAKNELFQAFAKQLSGSSLRGNFTMDGRGGDLKEESYDLESVTKLPLGNLWLFKTRIRYGDHDVTVPLPINVEWAGKTPVIVLDQQEVPGLGTFDARVVIAGDRYAGTWQHGNVGGHLFGRIVKATSDDDQEGADEEDDDEEEDDEDDDEE